VVLAVQWDGASHPAGLAASRARHLLIGAGTLLALTLVGTLGYVAIAGMTPLDALYMTVTTLSTVGYGEIRPLGAGGRVFTMGLIAAGVGTALYTAGAFAEFLVAGRLGEILGRRAMSKALASMSEHVIVCGYGRLGRALAAELDRSSVPLVVIDPDPAAMARAGERPAILASAEEEGVLERAGIARAHAIVAATGSEAVNVFVALAARDANPEIAIHARAETEAGVRRLRRAGATQVVSPHHLGGLRLAQAILRPAVVDFLELATPASGAAPTEIDLEEVLIAPASVLAGARLGELADRGISVSVVAVKRTAEPIALSPGPDVELRGGDRVVVVGERASVTRLADLAG